MLVKSCWFFLSLTEHLLPLPFHIPSSPPNIGAWSRSSLRNLQAFSHVAALVTPIWLTTLSASFWSWCKVITTGSSAGKVLKTSKREKRKSSTSSEKGSKMAELADDTMSVDDADYPDDPQLEIPKNDETESSFSFDMEVPNMAAFQADCEYRTETIVQDGFAWRFLVYPKGRNSNAVGVFLEIDDVCLSPSFSMCTWLFLHQPHGY
jgi:hypothetical protein